MVALPYIESNKPDSPVEAQGLAVVELHSVPDVYLHNLFVQCGLQKITKHRYKPFCLYQQGDIQFQLDPSAHGFSVEFSCQHDPRACSMGFMMSNVEIAAKAVKRRTLACRQKLLNIQLAVKTNLAIVGYVCRWGESE